MVFVVFSFIAGMGKGKYFHEISDDQVKTLSFVFKFPSVKSSN